MMAGGFGGYGAFGNAPPAAAEGGGFVSHAGDQPASQSARPRRGDMNVRPVTIRQLLHAKAGDGADSPAQFEGYEIRMVKIVAKVLHKTVQATSVQLQLTDGSGVIDLRMFPGPEDDEAAAQEQAACDVNKHVRVFATFQFRDGRPSLLGKSIRLIQDANEITHHYLNAIYAHCVATKGPLPKAGAAPGIKSEKTLKDRLLDHMRQFITQDFGVSRMSLEAAMPGHSSSAIREALGSLLGEGYIYECGDDHFKVS